MVLFLIIWFLIIVVGIKKIDKPELIFSKNNTLALRGISAFEIMLGHIGLATENIFLFPNRKAGILFVAVFFFLSGYGLMYSYEEKKNYINNKFVFQKACRILIPAYLVYILGILCMNKKAIGYNAFIFLRDALNLKKFFVETNWFVWEIFCIYILFYIFYNKFYNQARLYMFLSVLSFVVCAYYLKIDDPWYGSTLAFWFGLYYYDNRKEINDFFMTKWCFYIRASIIILGISIVVFFLDSEGILGNVISRNLSSVGFMVIIILCGLKYQIGNKVSYWLGKYSYEIYLFHIMLIQVFQKYKLNPILYGIIVIFSTIICAVVYKKIENCVSRKLYKSLRKSE